MKSKESLRKTALAKRRALSSADYDRRNNSLCEQLNTLLGARNIQSVHFFLPIRKNNEPDLTSLFPELWESGVKIMVSKTNFETKDMTHYWLTPETTLVINNIGIPEPFEAESANLNDAELIIVPLLLGDKLGNRIGYGGGFYDRMLTSFKGQTIGVSLAPLVDKLPTEEWDIPLNSILFPLKETMS